MEDNVPETIHLQIASIILENPDGTILFSYERHHAEDVPRPLLLLLLAHCKIHLLCISILGDCSRESAHLLGEALFERSNEDDAIKPDDTVLHMTKDCETGELPNRSVSKKTLLNLIDRQDLSLLLRFTAKAPINPELARALGEYSFA